MTNIFKKSQNSAPSPLFIPIHKPNKLNSKLLAQILVICACVIFAGSIVAAKVIIGKSHEIDEDLCLCGNDPKTSTAIILDLTDGLRDYQVKAFKEEMAYCVKDMLANDKLLLYIIKQSPGDKYAQIVKLFSKCKPDDGSDASSITDNKRLLKERYNVKFVDALQKVINGIDFGQMSDDSPILGTLYKTSKDPSFFEADNKKIIIFSNMMENSQLISHYAIKQFDFEQTSKLLPRVLDVGNSLRNTNVTVFLIPNKYNYSAHMKWWGEYFKHVHIDTLTVKSM